MEIVGVDKLLADVKRSMLEDFYVFSVLALEFLLSLYLIKLRPGIDIVLSVLIYIHHSPNPSDGGFI